MEYSVPRQATFDSAAILNPIADIADRRVVGLTFFAVAYNAILSFVNAHAAGLNFGVVALTEIMVIGAGLFLILRGGLSKGDKNVIYLVCLFVVLGLLVSMINQRVFVDALRNALIVSIFVCLGRRASRETIIAAFLCCSILVLAVLILEVSSVSKYAALLKPASYFINTRGMAEFKYNDTGLFNNALGFKGRFSYGIFDGPRTSSIFLEQVSLANYAAVTGVFLVSLWKFIGQKARVIHVGVVLLIIVSNNTRMTSILTLLSLVGYFLYPRVPKYSNAFLAPIIMAIAVMIYLAFPLNHTDTFVGRTSKTGDFLFNMSLGEYFGNNIGGTSRLLDSGYPYLISTATVIGFIAYWLFVCFIVPQNTLERRRCANALSLYIFMNLLVSGTAIFSMKTGAPLWLLVGLMSGPLFKPLANAVKPAV
ncbi:hypothetical protein [Pseudomonas huanghezhanensis]|uniref:hypothetical protein n=1 Tax=Pseudomonas huanghezhanensis TaxID=3002903 RepID=UPI0022857F15|nr:hypothetical protein [Pseudomonas sp. BSw22131]